MKALREIGAAARLDLAEILRSRWMAFSVSIYALLAAIFVLVGLRESSVLGFTGMGRVLFSLCHALVLVLPLLALTATMHVINRARDDGTLELLFTLPLRRSTYFAGVSVTRYAMLVLPLFVLLPALALGGLVFTGQAVPWGFLGRTLAVSASLLAAFTGLGLLVSTTVRHQARALLAGLLLWAGAVALLDFALVGLMLQWRLSPQSVLVFAALNPVEAARLALVAGAEPDLATLGPVGFYLAERIGGGALLALGIVWPAVVGIVSWMLAHRSFRRGDLV
jgi:ABC-type transport system involved in multi-copper enzyme maturation permease subunit